MAADNSNSNNSNGGAEPPFDPVDFMSSFSPELVHRVLLTDPSEYSTLTLSGEPQQDSPAFDSQFLWSNGLCGGPPESAAVTTSTDPANTGMMDFSRTMKKAFHESLVDAIGTRGDIDGLKTLILELHQKLRGLIPHRTDLHGILSDEDVESMTLKDDEEGGTTSSDDYRTTILTVVLPHLIKIGEALIQLESDDRSTTTRSWINIATNTLSTNEETPQLPLGIDSPIVFVVSSLAYLHLKADICSADVADFQLSTVLAPQIALHGPDYERSLFQQRFGPFESDETASITAKWIERTVEVCGISREELHSSEERRVTALQTNGWVDLILFQTKGAVRNNGNDEIEDSTEVEEKEEDHNSDNGDESARNLPFIHVPEVLQADINNLRSIRNTTRMSVIGSALALHACNVTGVGDSLLRQEPATDEINRCRDILVKAMSNTRVASQEEFEEGITSAVIHLGEVLKPNISESEKQMLSSRTPHVMRGDDPVVRLLDNRMRCIFCDMMTWVPDDNERLPLRMATGNRRQLSSPSTQREQDDKSTTTTISTLFLSAAKKAFMHRGFAFYAKELAEASLMATKVVNLTFVLFGEVLLDPIFSNVLRASAGRTMQREELSAQPSA